MKIPHSVWMARKGITVPRGQKGRRKLPVKIFAIPEKRAYPIHDEPHAVKALVFLLRTAGRHGPQPTAARKVISAIRSRWPEVYMKHEDLVIKAKRAHGVN